MSRLSRYPSIGLALSLAFSTAAVAGTVSVRYDHPENFTETKEVRAFAPSRADSGYLQALRAYIEKRAASVLQEGQTLDIVVTDIDRAGSYVPSMGSLSPVRVVEEVYPPRISLRFRLLDSQGQVLREGDRKLTDLGFMHNSPGGFSNTDPLRYEKRTIDRWLARGVAKL